MAPALPVTYPDYFSAKASPSLSTVRLYGSSKQEFIFQPREMHFLYWCTRERAVVQDGGFCLHKPPGACLSRKTLGGIAKKKLLTRFPPFTSLSVQHETPPTEGNQLPNPVQIAGESSGKVKFVFGPWNRAITTRKSRRLLTYSRPLRTHPFTFNRRWTICGVEIDVIEIGVKWWACDDPVR